MKLKAIIEIPAGSQYKYEMCKSSGRLVLDRPLNQLIPYNYGLLPNTLFDDGDPLDVFVISSAPIPSLTEVEIEVVGVLRCKDGGVQDDKIIGYLSGDDLPSEISPVLIQRYLETYKEGFIVEGYEGVEAAAETYNRSVEAYKNRPKKVQEYIIETRFTDYKT